MGLGLLWYLRLPADSEPWDASISDPSTYVPPADYFIDFLPAMIIFGIGLAIMVAPLTTALMRSVPSHNSGLASAINNSISRVGPQLFGALIFIAISATFYANFEDAAGPRVVGAVNAREEISPLNRPDAELGPEVEEAAADASTQAFQLAALVAAGLCLAGAVVNGIGIRNEQLHTEQEPAPPDAAAQPV